MVYIISLYCYIVVYWRYIIYYTNLLIHNGVASVKKKFIRTNYVNSNNQLLIASTLPNSAITGNAHEDYPLWMETHYDKTPCQTCNKSYSCCPVLSHSWCFSRFPKTNFTGFASAVLPIRMDSILFIKGNLRYGSAASDTEQSLEQQHGHVTAARPRNKSTAT